MICRKVSPRAASSAALAFAMSVAAAALGGCKDQSTPAEAPARESEPQSSNAPQAAVLPTPPPALSRGDLIQAADEAASAYAEGRQLTGADPLADRSFAIHVTFGCTGPTTAGAPDEDQGGRAAWSWGPDRKTIQLTLIPGAWQDSAIIAQLQPAKKKWEEVEGFWIPRPWMRSNACPAVPRDPLQPTDASPQTLGLAALYNEDSSRIGRRNGRAYTFTVRANADGQLAPPDRGYQLVLEGRIDAFPSGRAIECRAASPDQRPVCLVAVKLDRVAFEQPDGSLLSEWRAG